MRFPLRAHFVRARFGGADYFIRRFSPNPGWVPGISPRYEARSTTPGDGGSQRRYGAPGASFDGGKGRLASGSTGASLV